MGLDLTIREQTEFRTDDKGRTVWTTVELANFHNCWTILEKLGNRLDDGFSNCATYSFDEGTFHVILRELKEEFESNNPNKDEYLKCEIRTLEDFIKQEDIEDYEEGYGRCFEVHAYW